MYHCIAADPPWWERGGGKIKRGADRHYQLLRTPDIIRVMLQAPCWLPYDDCHLWLWVTNNHLPDGLRVMSALGFRYVTNACWRKMRIGLGQYLRGTHELCLFGVRGRQPSIRRDVCSLYSSPRQKHSEKPDGFYTNVIEAVSQGPRLEMFARAPRERWDVWGDGL